MSSATKVYICALCVTTYPKPGMCTEHPEEPLLDVGDDAVRRYLAELDAKSLRRRLARVTIGLSCGFGILSCAGFPGVFMAAATDEVGG